MKLIKVAKDFNVGLHTIVETLHSKGFLGVTQKPTTDISDEMLTVLKKEFYKPTLVEKKTTIEVGALPTQTTNLGNTTMPLLRPILAKKDPIAAKSKKVIFPHQIQSIEIQQFRNLSSLKLEGLKRVNLITGKNNCGKSSLLEAISLWAAKGRLNGLADLLVSRNEIYVNKEQQNSIFPFGFKTIDQAIENYSLLFSGRKFDFSKNNEIVIKVNDINELRIKFVKFVFRNLAKVEVTDKEVADEELEYNVGYKITFTGNRIPKRWLILSEDVVLFRKKNDYPDWLPKEDIVQIVSVTSSDDAITREQLNKIALTKKEDELVDILGILEPNIQRIGFSGDEQDSGVLIRVAGQPPFPLNSSGYGMSRMTALVLAMFNAENGFLLINEFENGLHWTVQKRLWEAIFDLSQKLKVQVFVTTHSEDAIQTFAEAAESKGAGDAAFIRLNRKGEEVTATHYEPSELLFATENDIETRGL